MVLQAGFQEDTPFSQCGGRSEAEPRISLLLGVKYRDSKRSKMKYQIGTTYQVHRIVLAMADFTLKLFSISLW